MDIYAMNTLEMGTNTIDILKNHIELKGVIGLSKRQKSNEISGYSFLQSYCTNNNLNFIGVKDYSLSSQEDKEKLLKLNIDILLVIGWQRLVPEWLIKHCNICAIGAHGSSRGITKGRGRSPLNWALILGETKFHISIFKLDAGIDSGDVIDTRTFYIDIFDDIRSIYYKNCVKIAEMIIENINNNHVLSGNFQKQTEKPEYFPKRLPKDGEIDWSRTSFEVYNFVRALTKPYPGAFSFLDNNKVFIWKGYPYELNIPFDNSLPGEIVKIFYNNDFLVKTGDSYFLVKDHELKSEAKSSHLKEKLRFSRCNFKKQIANIVNRHQKKYPELPVVENILNIIKEDK